MKDDQRRWFNPDMLRWARTRLRMDPPDVDRVARRLAETPGFTRVVSTQILEWESGHSEPSLADLETLAEIYECPAGYFLLDSPPPTAFSLSFRTPGRRRAATFESTTLTNLERFKFLLGWFTSAIRDSGIEWAPRVPHFNPGDPLDFVVEQLRAAVGFTRNVRSTWLTNRAAFDWWRSRIEDQGVFVFELPLNPRDVRGASAWTKDSIPGILVNHDDREYVTGRLFSLLHEYAHLVHAEFGYLCDFSESTDETGEETRANEIAARLLVRDDEFQNALKELGLDRPREMWSDAIIDRIRDQFRVSRDVTVILLERNNLAPRGFYNRKRVKWDCYRSSGSGGRGGGPPTKAERIVRSIGYSGARVLIDSRVAPVLSYMDLSEVLQDKVDRIDATLSSIRELLSRQ